MDKREYIGKNMVFTKDLYNNWIVFFDCADGYRYSINANEGGRRVKDKLKNRLIERVSEQIKHPIASEENFK